MSSVTDIPLKTKTLDMWFKTCFIVPCDFAHLNNSGHVITELSVCYEDYKSMHT